MGQENDKDAEVEAKYDATKSFSTFLPHVDDGALESEAGVAFRELLAALEAHAYDARKDAKGRLTLTLDVTVDEKGHASIVGDVATKKPKPRRGASQFWLLKGRLSTKNPRQQELPLRDVNRTERTAEAPPPATKGI